MKKIREISGNVVGAMLLAVLCWYCMAHTDPVKEAVAVGIERCTGIIIPSLYAMLVVSAAFVRSGIAGSLSMTVRRVIHRITGMDGAGLPIFLFSQIAGYPVGAGMLAAEYRAGRIDKRTAELLMGVSCGAGPAFVYGCISSRLYGGAAAGRIIMLSAIASNMIIAAVLSLYLRRRPFSDTGREKLCIGGDMFTDSVAAGGRAAAGICFMVMIFVVITDMLEYTGISGVASGAVSSLSGYDRRISAELFAAFLDVTAIVRLTPGNYALLPAVCALTSFGGVCVLLQIASVSGGELSVLPFAVIRTAAAALSFGICRAIMPHMLEGEAVPAAAGLRFHSAASPVPSVLLMLMTVMLLSETDAELRQSEAGKQTF
ncbi:MAG: hypothetical protein GXY08_03805 [Ruminococcus sp.]|nr:hypothetical protein [Ruminococcus sp.]